MRVTRRLIVTFFAFESRISEAIEIDPIDGMPVFTGECATIVIPWDRKQGGG